MLGVGSYFELLQGSLTGKLEATALLPVCDLFGCEQLAPVLGRSRFFLLLLD